MPRNAQYRTASRIVCLANAIIRQRNARLQPLGLTACQSEALLYLLRQPPDAVLTAGDVARALRLSQSTVAGILKRLEDKKLLARRTAPDDHRRNVLFLTENARQLDRTLFADAVAVEALLLKGMCAQQREQFDCLLGQALANVHAANREEVMAHADEP